MPNDRISRRDFSRRAAAAAAGLLIAGAAAAQEPSVPPADTPKPPAPPAPSPYDAVVDQIYAQCPDLPEADRKELSDQVKGVMDLRKTLAGFNVPDGAEPDFVFRAAKEAPHAR